LRAIVDDEDFDKLSQFSWHEVKRSKKSKNIYAGVVLKIGAGKGDKIRTTMHRMVLNLKPGEVCDHINGNGLDNRKENLRKCTHAENIRNQARRRHSEMSPYKGVRKYPTKKRGVLWMAYITAEKKRNLIGFYDSAESAARAYDEWAIKLHGKFASLNFPDGTIP